MAAVAIVAILVIGAMVIAHDGGAFSGEASKDDEGSSVSVEANGGGDEGGGEGNGGGGEEGGK